MNNLPHAAHHNSACDNCEYILDIYFIGDITHIWSKDMEGKTYHYPILHHPLIYVAADAVDDQYTGNLDRSLEEIHVLVASHPKIVATERVKRYLTSSHDHITEVIEARVYSPYAMEEVINDLRGKNLNMYNIDLNPRQQFFLDTNLSPMMACHIYTHDDTKLLDYLVPDDAVLLDRTSVHGDPTDIYYPIPPVRVMDIETKIDKKQTFPTHDDVLLGISLITRKFGEVGKQDNHSLEGEEKNILLQLVEMIEVFDPDLLNVKQGDKFVMNYLAHRAAYHDITSKFVLGRLDYPTYPRKETKGQTYMSYGQIMRREPVWYLPGRVHIDAENSFFLYESGIAGLLDLARMAGVPPARTSRSSIGTALTGIEFKVNASTIPPTLVPPNKATGEQFKPADHLLISDNGGLIYPATPGVYDRVWAIDFTSLYPMIMANHNIGNETVLCSHQSCKTEGRVIIVPEVKYHICRRRIGVVPRTMFLVLQKRLLLKMSKREAEDEAVRERFKGIDSAMKWILVSCFGYLGFKNARWGSIESHQCVTAYARRYLLTARQISEDFGFEVIGGITDSLFIRAKDVKNDTRQHIEDLVKEISRVTAIPVDVEGRFQWVVFGSVRDYHEVGALNRYFGWLDHGEFKLRGIKHRQRRAIKLELRFQEELLDCFKQATTVEEFHTLLPQSYEIFQRYIDDLSSKRISTTDLVMKLKSGRGAGGYKATSTVQALTVKRYEMLGMQLHPGMNFFFVVVDDSRKDVERVRIGPEIDDNTDYDPSYYITLLNKDYLEITEEAQRGAYGHIMYSADGVERSLEEFSLHQELKLTDQSSIDTSLFSSKKNSENSSVSLANMREEKKESNHSLDEYF